MNKEQLIREVAQVTTKTQAEVKDVVDTVFTQISLALVCNRTVAITGFGKFRPAKRSKGKCTLNGNEYTYPEHTEVVFAASSVLKELVNG
jgi:nucleoid DNA-binding protein